MLSAGGVQLAQVTSVSRACSLRTVVSRERSLVNGAEGRCTYRILKGHFARTRKFSSEAVVNASEGVAEAARVGRAETGGRAQIVRGVHAWSGQDRALRRHAVGVASKLAESYGFNEVLLPTMERVSLFQRSLGADSDVVSKEMFKVERSDSVLRPEGTAGAVNALFAENLHHKLPVKWWYAGPMFRYERPQAGRLREFWQFGTEAMGYDDPINIAENALLALSCVTQCGIPRDMVSLRINSLGDTESRASWVSELRDYFQSVDQLSEESQQRLAAGHVLRILDSKDPRDAAAVAGAPVISPHLSVKSRDLFASVQSLLAGSYIQDRDGISKLQFEVDPRLVRGLDYYENFAFEIGVVRDGVLGAKTAVGGGGCYDLGRVLFNHSVPSVGFALGVDRLSLVLKGSKTSPPIENLHDEACLDRLASVVVVDYGESSGSGSAQLQSCAQRVANEMRRRGHRCIVEYSGTKLRKGLRRASRQDACVSVIIGTGPSLDGDESVVVRNMVSGEQVSLSGCCCASFAAWLTHGQTKTSVATASAVAGSYMSSHGG